MPHISAAVGGEGSTTLRFGTNKDATDAENMLSGQGKSGGASFPRE